MADTVTYVPDADSDVQGGVYAGCTKFPDIWRGLAAPFAQVKQRAGGGGRQLSYITARQAMNRFDSVVGPENWEDRYYEVHGVLFCEITITLPDGRKISKSDGGGFKEMTERGQVDQENTDKTGPSDAFKRAAVKFGVARGLYQDGTVDYADDGSTAEPGQRAARAISEAKNKATPRAAKTTPRKAAPPPPPEDPGDDDGGQAPESAAGVDFGNLPRTARGIYPWMLEMEAKYRGLNLKSALNAWAKKGGLPFKSADWPETWGDGTPVLPDAIDVLVHTTCQFLGIEDPVANPQ